MKSNIIIIDNNGKGFEKAVEETKKVAAYQGLDAKKSTRLQLITEEMLSLLRSVTGDTDASFWIESEGYYYELHLGAKTVMDKEKRYALLSASTTRKNEAAKTFLGYLRDAFENAVISESDQPSSEIPYEIMNDIANRNIEDPEWDGYERSVLRQLADRVTIGIRGGIVDMTVYKDFA